MVEPRLYPSRPLVGAGAVVHRGGKVLLIKRKFPPNEGKWALPGGLVELGETVEDAAVREVMEETGLAVELEGLLDVQTDLHLDSESKPSYHYVLVDYLAKAISERVELNAESSAYAWFSDSQVSGLNASAGTRNVLMKFFARLGSANTRSARRPQGKRAPK